jgi:hypothetical protein
MWPDLSLSPIGLGKARDLVAMHKKNTVHCGVIESCKNCESLYNYNLHFVQPLLSSATKSKFIIQNLKTCDPVPANFWRETGPNRTESKISRIPDWIRPDRISGRLLIRLKAINIICFLLQVCAKT